MALCIRVEDSFRKPRYGLGLGFRGLGFRGLGFRVLGSRGLGFRVSQEHETLSGTSYGEFCKFI